MFFSHPHFVFDQHIYTINIGEKYNQILIHNRNYFAHFLATMANLCQHKIGAYSFQRKIKGIWCDSISHAMVISYRKYFLGDRKVLEHCGTIYTVFTTAQELPGRKYLRSLTTIAWEILSHKIRQFSVEMSKHQFFLI